MTKQPRPDDLPSAAAQTFAATRRAMGDEAFAALTATRADSRALTVILHNDPQFQSARQQMPWLPDLMAMELAAAESLQTPPAPALDIAGLEAAARDPMTLNLHLQPHIRLLRSGWDIPAIWQALAAGKPAPTDAAQESFTAVYNDDGNAAVWSISEAAYILLENLQAAPGFALAAAAALRIDPQFALDRFLAMLVQQQLLATR